MPIVISKVMKKPIQVEKLGVKDDLLPTSLEELADLYGTLNDQKEALMASPVFAKFAQVKTELLNRLSAEIEPADGAELRGNHWLLEVSPASKKSRTLREGAAKKIETFLGTELFHKLAKVTVVDCEKYLTPDQVAQVLSANDSYTNTRTIKLSFLG